MSARKRRSRALGRALGARADDLRQLEELRHRADPRRSARGRTSTSTSTPSACQAPLDGSASRRGRPCCGERSAVRRESSASQARRARADGVGIGVEMLVDGRADHDDDRLARGDHGRVDGRLQAIRRRSAARRVSAAPGSWNGSSPVRHLLDGLLGDVVDRRSSRPRSANAIASGRPTRPQPPRTVTSSSNPRAICCVPWRSRPATATLAAVVTARSAVRLRGSRPRSDRHAPLRASPAAPRGSLGRATG